MLELGTEMIHYDIYLTQKVGMIGYLMIACLITGRVWELWKLKELTRIKHLARWLAYSKASINASYDENDYEAFYRGF